MSIISKHADCTPTANPTCANVCARGVKMQLLL